MGGILFSVFPWIPLYFSSETQTVLLLRDGEHVSDSAGTGSVSIPNHLHHPTSNLLMEGSFILDSFRQNPGSLFASNTGIECRRRKIKVCLSPASDQ